MRVVITAATVGEWMPAFVHLKDLYIGESERLKVNFYQSGVGMLATSMALTRLVLQDKPDLIIQMGIAGSFKSTLPPGTVVVVKDEQLGDMGVEENGEWKDIFDLKLEKASYHPFEKRKLPNPWLSKYNLLKLPQVNAITVNQISTHKKRIHLLQQKYKPSLESMEGAALHYICKELKVPFIQIRAVSNFIGERDKTKWKMKEAIANLNQVVLNYVDALYEMK